MERVNLRHLKSLPEPIDIATLDVSFISLLKVTAWLCRRCCVAVLTLPSPRCRCCLLCGASFARARSWWCSSSRSSRRCAARCGACVASGSEQH